MDAQTLQTPAVDQGARRFSTYIYEGRYIIVELDSSMSYLEAGISYAVINVNRQTAWDAARAQDKAVSFIGLDGVERDLGIVAPPLTRDPRKITITDGFYILDGTVYKVQWNQSKTRVYAKQLFIGAFGDAWWDLAKGMVFKLEPQDAMTPEAALEFGKLYGVCFRCAATLTKEESIERGCGDTCAAHMGWL